MSGLCALGTTFTSITHGFVRRAIASVFSASNRRSGFELTASGKLSDKSRLLDPGTHARVGYDPKTSTPVEGNNV